MSYTVLARKYRSQTFDEVVGQEPIVATLKNAIESNRIHHGYLFTGTRGVGKTSMARILAKSLNCLKAKGPTAEPCGKCDSCEGVARGEDVDVIEIDAASNTGVDNIRELRSNAIYRPARSRFKIYIIDEVHMLSTGAFNALLKTLEEPPSHVKFIFATTEIQKVPATIQSRVQRFDFKSIPAAEIAGQLAKICKSEKVKTEEAALKRIARLGNGSMRDALSLLDQILSMTGANVTAAAVDELLPPSHDELLAELIDKLADSDAAGALEVADRSLGQGTALDHWCSLLIGQIRDLMILRTCGPETDLVDLPASLREQLTAQAAKFDPGAYVYMITLLEELRRSVKNSGSGRALVESAVVRMAEASNFSSIATLMAKLDGREAASSAPARPAMPPPTRSAPAATASASAIKKNEVTPALAEPPPMAAPVSAPPAPKGPPPREAPPRPAPMRRMTQADVQAAQAEPMVAEAISVFDGHIVDVQRKAPPGRD